MSGFNNLIKKYTIKTADKLKKVCSPLSSLYNFRHFWYTKTTAHGKLFTLSDAPDVHDCYYSTKSFLTNPFYRNPTLILPGFHYYESVKTEEFQSTLSEFVEQYPIDAGVFAVKYKGDLHTFGYSILPNEKVSLRDIVTDNYELLESFNTYFLKELPNIAKIDCDDFVDLPTELGDSYNDPRTGLVNKLSFDEKCAFLDRLGLITHRDIKRLSPRELECIKYLRFGLTAPEVAFKLNLSPRSVEKYIESIKNKLCISSKPDLIRLAEHLHQADCFPGFSV